MPAFAETTGETNAITGVDQFPKKNSKRAKELGDYRDTKPLEQGVRDARSLLRSAETRQSTLKSKAYFSVVIAFEIGK